MSSEVRVDPAKLAAQASAMRSITWQTPEVAPIPADALPFARDAVDRLNETARVLTEYQKWAEAENLRIAEILDNAAKAYREIDESYKDQLDDPGRAEAIANIALPAPSTAMPALPAATPGPASLRADEYSPVPQTHALLNGGDHGNSLQVAEVQWGLAGTFAEGHAAPKNITDWEGEAADAAHARMNAFSSWLHDLAGAWRKLAMAAAKVQASHLNANTQHIPVYARYVALEASLAQAGAGTDVSAAVEEMKELQRQSDEIRAEYARNASFDAVRVDNPPNSGSGAGTSGGGGAGGQPSGDPAAMAERMGESLAAPSPAAGGKPGGAPTGGGAPSGGGSPSGGGAPGGAPSSTPGGASTGAPPRHTDPSLRPAAAAGGGSAGGGGAGGGGGAKGAGSQPLSPAVTAETVAPAPVPVPTSASGAAPGPSTTGMMAGGGMGMAPMHGAAGAGQGKEKRRNPALAPDEDLYTEDRPWTEGVIGNRRRRESKEDQ